MTVQKLNKGVGSQFKADAPNVANDFLQRGTLEW